MDPDRANATDSSVGIVLKNGATAVNCNVIGFHTGKWLNDVSKHDSLYDTNFF